jgi:hypothetical protein
MNDPSHDLIQSLLMLKEIVETEYKDKIIIWKLDKVYSEAVRDYLSKERNTKILDIELFNRSVLAGSVIDRTSCTSYCVGMNGVYPVIRA